jgi:16S rRNA (cytidine1402-2'-O)-methyltransferase
MPSRPADAGRLLVVATPIGNLGDLSPRAVAALGSAALVCCEDTRRTGRLLEHAGVGAARLAVTNEHTELARVPEVLEVLAAGRDVALVTDAGTPAISDPGERLVRAVLDAGYDVVAVPGPAALVVALVASGLPTARFVFEGFLPRAGRGRQDRLEELAGERRTVVLYEAPHRVQRTLADLRAVCGPDRPAAVARELTKMYETIVRGPLGDLDVGTPRGEYVIVLAGAPAITPAPVGAEELRAAVAAALDRGMSTRDAAAEVARSTGAARRNAYDAAAAVMRARRATSAGGPPAERDLGDE